MTQPLQTVRIHPSGPLRGTIVPPSSKYHTLRYILAAILAHGVSTVNYPAISDDSEVLLNACAQLGAKITITHQPGGRQVLTIEGTGGNVSLPPRGMLDVGNAGAVLRLLLGICALSPETITFTTPYPASLGRRPNADLLQALSQLGASVESETIQGTLPVSIRRGGLRGGKVSISGKNSSQYISSLLFLAPMLPEGLEITVVDGLTSASFIDLTIRILEEAGIRVITRELHRQYVVPGGQQYQPRAYTIPGDYPSAAALLAAVAVAKGEISIMNLPPGDTDGESILRVFSEMGVQIERIGNTISAYAPASLRGISLDGNSTIDSVPVIAAAACFAHSSSHIYNVANLHMKESDRINDLAVELNKVGCRVTPLPDALHINPAGASGVHGGVQVNGHADHRLVQALTIVGLGSRQPVTIEDAGHIGKSYPAFFEDLTALGAHIEQV
jgi:3-phosphoshikimate 1-carboxyvinyltransferase